MSKKDVKYPKGYWMRVGISTGVAIGAALGVALENVGAGIALGVAIGAGIGTALEKRNKDNLRPLTKEEIKRQKWSIIAGLALVTVLTVTLVIAYLLLAR